MRDVKRVAARAITFLIRGHKWIQCHIALPQFRRAEKESEVREKSREEQTRRTGGWGMWLGEGFMTERNQRDSTWSKCVFDKMEGFRRSCEEYAATSRISLAPGTGAQARIRIAILDTGVNRFHSRVLDGFHPNSKQLLPELCRSWTYGASGVQEPYNVHDSDGHGTNMIDLLMRTVPHVEICVAKVFERRTFDIKEATWGISSWPGPDDDNFITLRMDIDFNMLFATTRSPGRPTDETLKVEKILTRYFVLTKKYMKDALEVPNVAAFVDRPGKKKPWGGVSDPHTGPGGGADGGYAIQDSANVGFEESSEFVLGFRVRKIYWKDNVRIATGNVAGATLEECERVEEPGVHNNMVVIDDFSVDDASNKEVFAIEGELDGIEPSTWVLLRFHYSINSISDYPTCTSLLYL
ncbi:hypothetical protein G7Y89_g1070 [Cudoniella acicularis]|uniref:Peptidase S8/S53 domain-containing protein n=1 Tax=Cudoniella acicularis TaxID=354080 RepID=A0A8H4RXS5_9HELO|nr:hypothetical protein G7Y89_g1070 [Cudoniella acicularis]